MKKIFAVLLIAVLLVTACAAVAACGPTGSKEGELKIWWPGDSASDAAIKKAKELYEAANPGVTITIVSQSTADFYASYNMALMGKDFPDIAYVDHVFVQRLAFDGLIANLSDLGVDEDKDKYLDSLWNTTQFNGNTYALPMSANVLVTAYNKALLSKVLGRPYTDADYPANWDEFIALGAKIAAYNTEHELTGNDQLFLTTIPAGTGAESMGAMLFMAYSAREGGTLMNSDLTAMTISSDANKAAATKILQLGELNYTPKNFSESKFETGKVAFIEMGPWKLTDYSRIADKNADCDFAYNQVIPATTGGSRQGALGLYSLVVTKKSTKLDLAADFVRFLTTNEEVQLLHNTAQNLMPTTKSALNNEFYQTPEWSVFVEQLQTIVARPGSAAWPTIESELAQYVTELVACERDSDYLDALEIRLDEALEDLEDE